MSSSCEVQVRVQVTVHSVGRRAAEALAKALRPDDATSPPWMVIREEPVGDDLRVSIEACINRSKVKSIRNTVDEIIEFLYAALKTIEEQLQGRQQGFNSSKLKEG